MAEQIEAEGHPSDETDLQALTELEVAFLVTLLAAHPPPDEDDATWTPAKELGAWPPNEYRDVWASVDNKLRSAATTGDVRVAAPSSVGSLLRRSRAILVELRRLGVIRTDNAPAGDYAEWLVKQASGGELEANANKSYDVLAPATTAHPEGERIQVKARSLSDPPKRGQRQLSVFRSWDFDFLIAVLFDESFRVHRAARLPASIVEEQGRRIEHVNGWRVMATDELLDLGDDWTDRLNAVTETPA